MSKSNVIFIVSHSLTYTGAPLVALDIADYLKNSHNISLINMNPGVKIEHQRQVPQGINLIHLPIWLQRPSMILSIANKILRLLTKKKVNLKKAWFFLLVKTKRPKKIIYNTFYHVDIQLVSNFLKIPSIRYLHENFGYLKNLTAEEISIINKGKKIIGCSPSVVSDALRLGIICDPNYLAATTDRNLLAFNERLSCWGRIRRKKSAVITVGSGYKRKGGQYAERFAFAYKNVSYNWVGEVEDPNKFVNVIYHGPKVSVPYELADSFFLISEEEPWSIAAIEAMAYGLVIFGWEHLSLIQELKKYDLAIAVDPFNIKHLYKCYSEYDFKNHYLKADSVRKFLFKYKASETYSKIWGK